MCLNEIEPNCGVHRGEHVSHCNNKMKRCENLTTFHMLCMLCSDHSDACNFLQFPSLPTEGSATLLC